MGRKGSGVVHKDKAGQVPSIAVRGRNPAMGGSDLQIFLGQVRWKLPWSKARGQPDNADVRCGHEARACKPATSSS